MKYGGLIVQSTLVIVNFYWTGTNLKLTENFNFLKFLEIQAEKYKNRQAVSNDKMNLDYRELLEKSMEFASGLRNRGLRTGNKVALLMYNRPEFIIAFFGIIIAGGIVVPINPFFVPEEVEYIIRHSEAAFFISSQSFQDYIHYIRKNVDDINVIISADCKKENDRIIPFNNVYIKRNGYFPETKKTDICAILYSSGTEGNLRGVLMSQENLLSNAIATADMLKIRETDKMVTFLPLFHPFSLTVGLLMMFAAGGSILLVDNALPFKKLVMTVFLKRATLFIGIPEVFKLLSSLKTSRLIKLLNPIRFCISGGSPLPVEVLKSFETKFHVPIIEGYGLLEAGPVVSVNPSELDLRKPGSVGKLLNNVKAIILDISTKKPLKKGSIGEIAVKGDGIMQMYYKDSAATKNVFFKGWLLTGDLGKFDDDGYLYIIDRKTGIIFQDGKVIFSREIEEILHEHPSVEECAVVGIADRSSGKKPAAIIVLKQGDKTKPEEIYRFITEKGSPISPDIIEFWDELPRSSTGKILKREIIRILTEK